MLFLPTKAKVSSPTTDQHHQLHARLRISQPRARSGGGASVATGVASEELALERA